MVPKKRLSSCWDQNDEDLIDEDPPDANTPKAATEPPLEPLAKCPDCQDGWYTGLIERRVCETCRGHGYISVRE